MIFSKIKDFLTPKKFTTVWRKPVKGYSSPLFGETQRNLPMVISLQVSNKNTRRWVLSDGDTKQIMDEDYVLANIKGSHDALVSYNTYGKCFDWFGKGK